MNPEITLRERQEKLLRDQIEEITDGIEELKESNAERFTVKELERTKKSLQARLEKLQSADRKDAKGLEAVPIGSYRGFNMSLTLENFGKNYILTLKGEMSHRVELGGDARGNLIRIDNVLNQIPARIEATKQQLESVRGQLETAKSEVGKPFPQEVKQKRKRRCYKWQ